MAPPDPVALKIIEAHKAEFFSKNHIEHGAKHHLRVYDDIQQLLADEQNPTPLVRLSHISPFQHTEVYGKIEWYNPYGSVKVMDGIDPAAQLRSDARAPFLCERAGVRTVAFVLGRTALRQTCSRMLRTRGGSGRALTRCSSSNPRLAIRVLRLQWCSQANRSASVRSALVC
jgi:hypothetical protein